MSLGLMITMFGLALFCRSISILLFSVILFLVLHGIVVLWEDSFLEKRYRESYVQYRTENTTSFRQLEHRKCADRNRH
jgi:protein-S-isoprenylcysteine O-methyltransferase Ste14